MGYAHGWDQLAMKQHSRLVIPIVIFLLVLLCLAGCKAGQSILDTVDSLMPWNWGKSSDPTPKGPQDATQTQVAWYVTGALRWGSGILMGTGVLIGILGNWSRALVSFGVAIGLMVINGILLTLLKNETAMWILLAVTGAIIAIFTYLDMRDGVAWWQRKIEHEETMEALEDLEEAVNGHGAS